MRAVVRKRLEPVPPKVTYYADRGRLIPTTDNEEPHFKAEVEIYGPFHIYYRVEEGPEAGVQRLENDIISAIVGMFDKPPQEEQPMPSLLQCDDCETTTSANRPGRNWKKISPLHRDAFLQNELDRYFCSDQCEFNHLMRNAAKPIVVNARI